MCRCSANLLHCRSPLSFIFCASSASITWERTASRRTPAFSSHLVSPTMPSSPSRSENKLACMTRTELGLIAIVVILALSCCRPRPRDKSFTDEQQPTTEAGHRDESPHTVHFVTVDGNVKLEVLDWGGSGRALVLVAGMIYTYQGLDLLST